MTERRIGLIEFGKALNNSVSVPGLGELPGGQVSAGRATRGARARLIRFDRVVADNLRLGIVVRKKFFSSDVEPVTEAGFLKDVFVVTGRDDLGNGDALELYSDDTALPDTSRQVGLAQVHAPAFDEITGVRLQVHQHSGVLREGSLVGLLRGGRGGGLPMRVLRLLGPVGPVPELRAGQPGTVLLGFQCEVPPMPGDALACFHEPEQEYLEQREGIAVVHGLNPLPDGSVVAAVEVPEQVKSNQITVGSMVRVLRPAGTTFNERSTVVATGLRVTSLSRNNVMVPSARGTGVFTVGLTRGDVREGDTIEVHVPAPGTPGAGQPLAPPPPLAPPGPPSRELPVPQAAPGPVVDLNTAPPPELARLPGMTPQRVAAAIELRTRQGGFADVEAFGVAIGLQPHEIVRLRGKVTTSRIQHHGGGVRQLDI
ncbi:ComEA family DNA-binding protein [Amycolatopsis suaedae]|uniref:Helix-hairpin-helix domain-containing protein n=1 Tax=Amycolatopsis suaedae TaxID=2510978 RepID=A0A4Q7JC84_9PSEU|nr:helix-hairpin-helix domain-containing protein [Amycolatopsis suaedae]RZQ64632.1 hypothetical protein EWH70_06965 [Amycolatopsis suaedae]